MSSQIENKAPGKDINDEDIREKFPLVAGFFLDDKKLFFVTGLGNLYCVDIKTGKILWLEKFGIQFSRPPIINKNKIFLISDDNQLYTIDKNTRKIV